jgi:hypothetical protein
LIQYTQGNRKVKLELTSALLKNQPPRLPPDSPQSISPQVLILLVLPDDRPASRSSGRMILFTSLGLHLIEPGLPGYGIGDCHRRTGARNIALEHIPRRIGEVGFVKHRVNRPALGRK